MSEVRTGLFLGLTKSEYQALPGWNWSVISRFKRSAAHARSEQLMPPESEDWLDQGDAFHRIMLQPESFERDFVVVPEDAPRRQGKANLEWWARFELENEGKTRLTVKEATQLLAWRDGLLANPEAAALLAEPRALKELSLVWVDEEWGVPCKARIDLVAPWRGASVIADVKTTRDASAWSFAKDMDTFDYAAQLMWYRDGLQMLRPVQGGERIPRFLVVEKEPPYCGVVYELGQVSRDVARAQAREMLRRAVLADRDNRWPGYPDGVIELPAYALNRTWGGSN